MHYQKIIITTPWGNICLVAQEGYLIESQWTKKRVSANKPVSSILKQAVKELNEYFTGTRKKFDVPLRYYGTAFQEDVWKSLLTIPYGKTKSYRMLAHDIGRDNAVRAVGSANGKNKLCIFIPCHRVIRSSGELGGYVAGTTIKKALLDLEQQYIHSTHSS